MWTSSGSTSGGPGRVDDVGAGRLGYDGERHGAGEVGDRRIGQVYSPGAAQAEKRSSIQCCIKSNRFFVAFEYWPGVVSHGTHSVPPCVAPSIT
jgi:hypothetical protein